MWVNGQVWFVDILAPCIYAYDPVTQQSRSWPAPQAIGFILPCADGLFVVGLKTGLHKFNPVNGSFTELCLLENAVPDCRINDGAVDASGHLWFGTLDETEQSASGALYRLDDDGKCRPRDEGYIVTNGPSFSPDGRTLYHTDSQAQTIYAFDMGRNGELSGKRVFAEIERPGVYPDGIIVDEEGCLWVGLFGGWGAERYAPTGERLEFIEFPCSRVTKLAFGGHDLKTMFATTARKGIPPKKLQHEPEAGALFAFATGVRGLTGPSIKHGINQN